MSLSVVGLWYIKSSRSLFVHIFYMYLQIRNAEIALLLLYGVQAFDFSTFIQLNQVNQHKWITHFNFFLYFSATHTTVNGYEYKYTVLNTFNRPLLRCISQEAIQHHEVFSCLSFSQLSKLWTGMRYLYRLHPFVHEIQNLIEWFNQEIIIIMC